MTIILKIWKLPVESGETIQPTEKNNKKDLIWITANVRMTILNAHTVQQPLLLQATQHQLSQGCDTVLFLKIFFFGVETIFLLVLFFLNLLFFYAKKNFM